MRYLNMIINFVFGTNRPTTKYIPPSKERLIMNMYRPYAHRDWD